MIAIKRMASYAGAPSTFSGTLFARNGYASGVNLACTAGSTAPPHSCSARPASVTPPPQGAIFTLSANDVAGDDFFNMQAARTDPALVTHTFPLILHVVYFTLGQPSPNSLPLRPGTTSSPISLTVSAAGSFTRTANFSRGGMS